MYTLIVCGGRNYDDQAIVDSVLETVWENLSGGLRIVHGGASGADACAHAWALAKRASGAQIEVEVYPADWERHGKAAGPIRNRAMLDLTKPHAVVAFPGGAGTENMVRQARQRNIEVYEIC